LAISSFKKGQILQHEKRINKGQISFKKIVKIFKYTILVNIQKRPKNGQMTKPFISGKHFQKDQMATLVKIGFVLCWKTMRNRSEKAFWIHSDENKLE